MSAHLMLQAPQVDCLQLGYRKNSPIIRTFESEVKHVYKQMSDPVAIGIQRIINSKGLLQKDVAKRAGFSEQQFSNMLHNRKIIKASDLSSISAALGVCILEIYEAGLSESG